MPNRTAHLALCGPQTCLAVYQTLIRSTPKARRWVALSRVSHGLDDEFRIGLGCLDHCLVMRLVRIVDSGGGSHVWGEI
jgi:hypothetical protein